MAVLDGGDVISKQCIPLGLVNFIRTLLSNQHILVLEEDNVVFGIGTLFLEKKKLFITLVPSVISKMLSFYQVIKVKDIF